MSNQAALEAVVTRAETTEPAPVRGARVRAWQAWTGIGFGTFVLLHLVNTWLAGFSMGVYDDFQSVAQRVYQQTVIEAVLLSALLIHVICGVRRWRQVSAGRAQWSPARRLHRLAAIVLMTFIAGHILAVRGPSWFAGVWPGAAGIQFSIDYLPLWFYPYYFVFAVAGLYHGWFGVLRARQVIVGGARGGRHPRPPSARPGWRTQRGPFFWLVPAAGAAMTVAALLGFGGWLYPIPDPAQSAFGQLVLELTAGLGF